jgi:hypothetical protein
MKKLILAAITVTTAASVFAQGTVIFNNRLGGISHVWMGGTSQIQGNSSIDTPTGSTVYGAGYTLIGTSGGLTSSNGVAQLLAAPGSGAAESSLVPSGGTTTFRTGAGAGNIVQITDTLQNIPKDAAFATFEMVAWDNTSLLYPTWAQASVAWNNGLIAAGRSAPFTVASIGGDVNTPPNLVGLTSFNIYIVPEPATVALAGLGAAALLIFRRRK